MASNPGPLTNWPWQKLGNFKYMVLSPFMVHGIHSLVTEDDTERVVLTLCVFPLLLWRLIHSQIWISFARYQSAKTKHRIVDKGLEFEQVDRERNWDDQVILNGIIGYIALANRPQYISKIPFWSWDGLLLTILLHTGPVEFLYYWFHRALHHHYLYSRYHSHHHSSIVTEPITSVTHPFAELIVYYLLFLIPMLAVLSTGTASVVGIVGYLTYLDFMNYMGHCNFEIVPKWVFDKFIILKYFMYTPSFHSLHHTKFRTNYSLFMPLYDYIYGTMDDATDELYQASLKGRKEIPDVIHLTHTTTLESFYHLPTAIASLASKPYSPKWYLWMLRPMSYGIMLFTWIFGSTFTVERNVFDKLKMQVWVIPRPSFYYSSSRHEGAINALIEKAISKADGEGVKVISLGLLNQGQAFNGNGELYLQKYPKLKIRIVDGSSLAVAVILNSIPQGAKQALLIGNLSKVACAVSKDLCQRGIQVLTGLSMKLDSHFAELGSNYDLPWILQCLVAVACKNDFDKLRLRIPTELWSNLVFSTSHTQKVWLVGDGGVLRDEAQRKAPEGTHFIPCSQFPPAMVRKECVYYSTPAMVIPKAFQNVYSCENWLPRRVMSAWRVAAIVHALEGWNNHECGDVMLDVKKVWYASLRHGFLPVVTP